MTDLEVLEALINRHGVVQLIVVEAPSIRSAGEHGPRPPRYAIEYRQFGGATCMCYAPTLSETLAIVASQEGFSHAKT